MYISISNIIVGYSIIIFPLSLLTFFIPLLNPLLNIFINIEENLIMLLNNINIFNITLKEMNILFSVFYYILIIFIIRKLMNRKYKYLLLILITLLIHNNINYLNKNMFVTTIDVGQGDSLLIEYPHNKNVLIDTGGIINYDNKNTYSLGINTIIPYLKSRGIKKLDYLILRTSFMSGDLISGIKTVYENSFYIPSGEADRSERRLV